MGHARNLASIGPGQAGVVASIQGGLGITGRLDALGIRPGVAVVKIAGQPFGGPVVVQVGNTRIAVGFGMAKKILVETDLRQEQP